jgi:hypothetical protein
LGDRSSRAQEPMASTAPPKGPDWHIEKPLRKPPVRTELRRESLLRNQEDLNEGPSNVQDNQGVESRDMQSKS